MPVQLHEFVDSRGRGLHVDPVAGIIRGVKLLGLESRNGRSYLPEALRRAASLYEGAKVNVNHPKGAPQSPRDYQDRLGYLAQVACRDGEGLFADLHFNPKHALAEQLAWDAQHAPENVGLSHNVQARVVPRDGREVVEAILRVQSVDLVADPATTRGLFEQHGLSAPPADGETIRLSEATVDQLRAARPDLAALVAAAATAELRGELESLRSAERTARRAALIERLLAEHGLSGASRDENPNRLVSEPFLASLRAAADDATVRRLVEERGALIAAARERGEETASAGWPRSREQRLVDELPVRCVDARSFAASIRR